MLNDSKNKFPENILLLQLEIEIVIDKICLETANDMYFTQLKSIGETLQSLGCVSYTSLVEVLLLYRDGEYSTCCKLFTEGTFNIKNNTYFP